MKILTRAEYQEVALNLPLLITVHFLACQDEWVFGMGSPHQIADFFISPGVFVPGDSNSVQAHFQGESEKDAI